MIKKQATNRYAILLDKHFTKMLNKFLADIKKQSVVVQKKTLKVKTKLSKTAAQLKQSDARVKTLSQTASTPNKKKKLILAKKIALKVSKLFLAIHKKLDNFTQIQEQLTQEQNALLALRKHFNQFELSVPKVEQSLSSKTKIKKTGINKKQKPKLKASPRVKVLARGISKKMDKDKVKSSSKKSKSTPSINKHIDMTISPVSIAREAEFKESN